MQIFKHHHVTRSKVLGLIPKVVFFFFSWTFFVVCCVQRYKLQYFFCFLHVVFFRDISFFQRMFFQTEMLHVRFSAWNPGLVEDAFLRCVSEQGQVSSGEESSYFFLGGVNGGGLCKKPAIAIAGRVHQKSRDSHGSKMDTVQLGMQQGLGLLAGPIHQSSRYLKHQHIGWLYGCCIYWKPAFHHLKHVLFIHFQYFNKRPSSWSAIWTVVSRYLLGHVGESCRANPEADSRGEPKTGAGTFKMPKMAHKNLHKNFGKPNQPKKNQMNHRKP